MTDPTPAYLAPPYPSGGALVRPQPATLADVVERVLDKGIVITGDIRVDLVGVELLTIRLRLVVASVDRAREMGIDWWEHDPMLSSRAWRRDPDGESAHDGDDDGNDEDEPAQPATGAEADNGA